MTFLAPAVRWAAGRFAAAEQTGGLEDIVDTELLPRQLGRIALGEDLHPVAVDDDVRAIDLDGALVEPVHRVVVEQIAEHVGRGEVVDGDQIEAVTGLEMTGHAVDRCVRNR